MSIINLSVNQYIYAVNAQFIKEMLFKQDFLNFLILISGCGLWKI